MKQKIDFVLNEYREIHKDIIRFYPRGTHVHGFGDEAPKTWDEVYKVYYSWAIIRQYRDYKTDKIKSKILFSLNCDECSMIPNLSEIIKNVMKTGDTFDYPTFGQPAGDWCVEQKAGSHIDENGNEIENYKKYKFQVFNNCTNQGYRFTLNTEDTMNFCKWLDKINQYALEHSEGI